MRTYKFNRQFYEQVRNGTKRTTVRRLVPDTRPIVGEKIGLRTVDGITLGMGTVTAVRDITMRRQALAVDGIPYGPGMRLVVAAADGFRSWEEFETWIRDHYGLPFRGAQIEWERV